MLGLSVKSHQLAKKCFQSMLLPAIFDRVADYAEQALAGGDDDAVLDALVSLLEATLCWNFRLSTSDSDASDDALRPIFIPGPEFTRPLFAKPSRAPGFFLDLFVRVRSSPNLAPKALTCLSQLASLSGPVLK